MGSQLTMCEPTTPTVFYHYTTPECLEKILGMGMILPYLPPTQIPSDFAGINIRKIPTIFSTRMDPSNSKRAIAFNNYSDAWRSKLRNVESWIPVKLVPGPHLLEKTVP